MRRTVVVVACASALLTVSACGRSPDRTAARPNRTAAGPNRTTTLRAEAVAVVECKALQTTLAQPQSAWANGIFAIGASGTPPRFAAAVTRMEIAVGDSYGPQLSPATLQTIMVVAGMCTSHAIGVGPMRLSPTLRQLRGRDSNSQPTG